MRPRSTLCSAAQTALDRGSAWYLDSMRRLGIAAFAVAAACAGGSTSDGGGSIGLGGSTGGRAETGTGTPEDGETSPTSDPDDSNDGPGDATDGMTDTGVAQGCGDGNRDGDEECDDGNLEDGDGCNADCKLSGQVLWNHFGAAGFGLTDDALGVAPLPGGDVIAVGMTSTVDDVDDQWMRRLSDQGGMLWTKVHDGPAGGNDQLRGVTVDTAGSIYVAGYQGVTGESANVFVRKYDNTGDPQWTDTFDGGGGSSDVANAIIEDPDGNFVVAGYVTITGEGRNVWVRKYSPDGNVLWTRTWAGDTNEHDVAWAIAASGDGHYYVAGSTEVGAEGENTWLGKLDIDGNVLWTRSHNGQAGLGDRFRGVTADASGVVVCGYEDHGAYPWQAFLRKYDADGAIEWTVIDAGGTTEGAHCFDVEQAGNGDYVWGGGENFMDVRHAVVARIAADGTQKWRSVLPSPADGPDFARDIAFTAQGSILVGGRIDAGTDADDAWIALLTP